jgi:hypothetical protein
MADRPIPTIYFPRKPGEQGHPEPVPYVLTDDDLIRLFQLTNESPHQTLQRYRAQGLLRAFQVSRFNRYSLPEVLAFVERLELDKPR